MNIILASVTCLPILIYGKVAVIHPEGDYELLNPSKFTSIEDHYNPMDYSILIDKRWSRCIVYSSRKEREHFMTNSILKGMNNPSKSVFIPYREGDKVHLHSRMGMYTIHKMKHNYAVITCKRWQYGDSPYLKVPIGDIKCLAGGLHNYAE